MNFPFPKVDSRKIISFFLTVIFTVEMILSPSFVQAQTLPAVNLRALNAVFQPVNVIGLTIHPDNPFLFDFMIDAGDDNLQGKDLERETQKLTKYFLAALTTPEDQLWVNLNPREKNRIVSEHLGQTDMGRDLLKEDYLLKQLTASLLSPESESGKLFWEKVYAEAEKKGVSDIPVETLSKVWIVPDEANVHVNGNNVFVADAKLKVLMDSDYASLPSTVYSLQSTADSRQQTVEEILKEILIPAITREVNESKNFTNLRQIYNAVILATWYKQNLKQSLLTQSFADQNKVSGIDLSDKNIPEKIYNQYLEAFKQGASATIKEEYDPKTQEVISKRYITGGADLAMTVGNKATMITPRHPFTVRTEVRAVRKDAAMTTPATDAEQQFNDLILAAAIFGHGGPFLYDEESGDLREGEEAILPFIKNPTELLQAVDSFFESLFSRKRLNKRVQLRVADLEILKFNPSYFSQDSHAQLIKKYQSAYEGGEIEDWEWVTREEFISWIQTLQEKLTAIQSVFAKEQDRLAHASEDVRQKYEAARDYVDHYLDVFGMLNDFLNTGEKEEIKDFSAWLENQSWDSKGNVYPVEIDDQSGSPIKLKTVPRFVHRAFERINSNAFQAMDKVEGLDESDKKVLYKITREKTSQGNALRVRIINPGSMSQEVMSKLFVLNHERSHFSRGIGLKFAYRAIEKVGGTMSVTQYEEDGQSKVEMIVDLPMEDPAMTVGLDQLTIQLVDVLEKMEKDLRDSPKDSWYSRLKPEDQDSVTKMVKRLLDYSDRELEIGQVESVTSYVFDLLDQLETIRKNADFNLDQKRQLSELRKNIKGLLNQLFRIYQNHVNKVAENSQQYRDANNFLNPSVLANMGKFMYMVSIRHGELVHGLITGPKEFLTDVPEKANKLELLYFIRRALRNLAPVFSTKDVLRVEDFDLITQTIEAAFEDYLATKKPPTIFGGLKALPEGDFTYDDLEDGPVKDLIFRLAIMTGIIQQSSPGSGKVASFRKSEFYESIMKDERGIFSEYKYPTYIDTNVIDSVTGMINQILWPAVSPKLRELKHEGKLKAYVEGIVIKAFNVLAYDAVSRTGSKKEQVILYLQAETGVLSDSIQRRKLTMNAKTVEDFTDNFTALIEQRLADKAMTGETLKTIRAMMKPYLPFDPERPIQTGPNAEIFKELVESFSELKVGEASRPEDIERFTVAVEEALRQTGHADEVKFAAIFAVDILSIEQIQTRFRSLAANRVLHPSFKRIQDILTEEAFKNGYIFQPFRVHNTGKIIKFRELMNAAGPIVRIHHADVLGENRKNEVPIYAFTFLPYQETHIGAQLLIDSFLSGTSAHIIPYHLVYRENREIKQAQGIDLYESDQRQVIFTGHEFGHESLMESVNFNHMRKDMGVQLFQGQTGLGRLNDFINGVEGEAAPSTAKIVNRDFFSQGDRNKVNLNKTLWEAAAFSFSLEFAAQRSGDSTEILKTAFKILRQYSNSIEIGSLNNMARAFWVHSLFLELVKEADEQDRLALERAAHRMLSIAEYNKTMDELLEGELIPMIAKLDFLKANRTVFQQITGYDMDRLIRVSSDEESIQKWKAYVHQQPWGAEMTFPDNRKEIDPAMTGEGRLIKFFGSQTVLDYFSAVQKRLHEQTSHPIQKVVALASGADISSILLSTDATDILLIDQLPFYPSMNEKDPLYSKSLRQYVKSKQEIAMANGDTLRLVGGIQPFLKQELKYLGARKIQWSHPYADEPETVQVAFMFKGKRRTVTFVGKSQVMMIEDYRKHLDEWGVGEIDGIFMKAMESYDSTYFPATEKIIKDYLKPDGFAVLDVVQDEIITPETRKSMKWLNQDSEFLSFEEQLRNEHRRIGYTESKIEGSFESHLGLLVYQKQDKAMMGKTPGGIDLNPAQLKMNTRGDAIQFNLPTELQNFDVNAVKGFVPVIINITPIPNFPMLLGIKKEEETEELSRL